MRYVLDDPLLVDSGMHRCFGQPLRAVVGGVARVFGQSTATAARPLADHRTTPSVIARRSVRLLVVDPPAAPLTGLRRGKPVPVGGVGAERLYGVLESLAAGVLGATGRRDRWR